MTRLNRPEPPTAADIAKAKQFVTEEFAGKDPVWLAAHREDLIRQAAVAFQFKRQDRAFREAIRRSAEHDRKCLEAVEELPVIRSGLEIGKAA